MKAPVRCEQPTAKLSEADLGRYDAVSAAAVATVAELRFRFAAAQSVCGGDVAVAPVH